jgi:hypothetical protein
MLSFRWCIVHVLIDPLDFFISKLTCWRIIAPMIITAIIKRRVHAWWRKQNLLLLKNIRIHPPLLSLSLSLSHTHTHTHTQMKRALFIIIHSKWEKGKKSFKWCSTFDSIPPNSYQCISLPFCQSFSSDSLCPGYLTVPVTMTKRVNKMVSNN